MREATAPETSARALRLDPFSYNGGAASRIAGLGGERAPAEPTYAFHTHYVAAASGLARIALRFTGLTATTGTLKICVNALPQSGEPRAQRAKTWLIPLADLAAAEGRWEAEFRAKSYKLYAILAYVRGDSDACAAGLAVEMEAGDVTGAYARKLAVADKPRLIDRLFGRTPPVNIGERATLANPVSQTCTAAQLDEPDFLRWMERLGTRPHPHRKLWEFAYILQALQHHGMLRPGHRGLGFGVGQEDLPALLAAMGIDILATDLPSEDVRTKGWVDGQHLATLHSLRRPKLCPNAMFDRHVSYRAQDMNHIDADLTGYDFTWSACALEHLGSIEAGLQFIRNSVACLRPGGIAVHTTEYNLVSNGATVDHQSTVLFRRRDVERLAAELADEGHWVAPLRFDPGDRPLDTHIDVPPYTAKVHLKLALGRFVTTSFGLIVRRAA